MYFGILIGDTQEGSKAKFSHQPPLHGLPMFIIYIVLSFHSCKMRNYKMGDSPPISLAQRSATNTTSQIFRYYSQKGNIHVPTYGKVQAFLKYEALHR